MENSLHWKRIWIAISGTREHIHPDAVQDIFNICLNDLLKGIIIYKPFTKARFKTCIEEISKTIPHLGISPFVYEMSTTMNLDPYVAWGIFLNYIQFEYYLELNNINQILDNVNIKETVINNLLQFYRLERMYMLRTLQCIIENYKNMEHKNFHLYQNLLKTTSFKDIRQNLINQYIYLTDKEYNINDICSHVEYLQRDNEEQAQILLILLTTMVYDKMDILEFLKVLGVFHEQNFMCSLHIRHHPELYNRPIIDNIRILEISIFIVGLDNFWNDHALWFSYHEGIEFFINQLYVTSSTATLLLSYVALRLTVPVDIDLHQNELNMYTYLSTALQERAFCFLIEIISHGLFKDLVVGMTLKTSVYKILKTLCIKLGTDKIYEDSDAVNLLGKLLQKDFLKFWNNGQEDIQMYYNNFMVLFPYAFIPFSYFMESLIIANIDTESVVNTLRDITQFTQKYLPQCTTQINSWEVCLSAEYRPFKYDYISFPEGTKVVITKLYDERYATLHGHYNYFKLLLIIFHRYMDEIQIFHHSEMTESALLAGYRLFLAIMKADFNLINEYLDTNEHLKMTFSLLRTCSKEDTLNVNIVKLMFEILQHYLKYNSEMVIEELISIRFLPKLPKSEFAIENCVDISLLSESRLIELILKECYSSNSVDLMLLYIQFIRNSLQVEKDCTKVAIPGIMFFTLKILPSISSNMLHTKDIKIKKVLAEFMELIYIIFDKRKKEPNKNTLICDYLARTFLNKNFYITFLENIVSNMNCESLMNSVTNHKSDDAIVLIMTIKRTLCLIEFLLKYVKLYSNIYHHVSFDKFLCGRSNNAYIQQIVGYMDYTFDEEIPKIVCNILINLAEVSDRSLFEALEIDNRFLNKMFYEKLEDPLINGETKVLLINVVKACLNTQVAMTAAFFGISPLINTNITMIKVMDKYIKELGKDPELITNPLHATVIKLTHKLWKGNKQHIIQSLIDEETFWPTITDCLIKPIKTEINIPIMLIEMLTIYLCKNKGKENKQLDKEINKIFDKSHIFVVIWLNRLTAFTNKYKDCDTTTQNLQIEYSLVVWKKFILTITHFYPEFYNNYWNKETLERSCLNILAKCCYIENKIIPTIWAELCLTFCSDFFKRSEIEEKEIIKSLTDILSSITYYYEEVDENYKIAVLLLASRILKKYKGVISKKLELISVLEPFKVIFQAEFCNVSALGQEQQENESSYYKWLLIQNILNGFLQEDTILAHEKFFANIHYLKNISCFLKGLLNSTCPIRVTEATCISLIYYSKSPLYKHFLYYFSNVMSIFMLPVEYFPTTKFLRKGVLLKHMNNWWTICAFIMQLNGILLQRCNGYILNKMIDYVSKYYFALKDSILTATIAANDRNLKMVISILHFMSDLLVHRNTWEKKHKASLDSILDSIKEVLNMAITVITKPQQLICVPIESTFYWSNPPQPTRKKKFISLMNNYVNIIGWSCLCLSRFNSPFIELLSVHKPKYFNNFIDQDFRVPPIKNSNPQSLTYGSLLSVLNFIVTLLNKMSMQDKGEFHESLEISTLLSDIELYQDTHFYEDCNILFSSTYLIDFDKALNEFWDSSLSDAEIHLDENDLHFTLNTLTSLLAGHSYLVMKETNISNHILCYIRRELCSELTPFYSLISKKILTDPSTKQLTYNSFKLLHSSGFPEIFLGVDVKYICENKFTEKSIVASLESCYYLTLIHWFRNICGFMLQSNFDKFLSDWHAKTTYIYGKFAYIRDSHYLLDVEDFSHLN